MHPYSSAANTLTELGDFEGTAPILILSDPCYSKRLPGHNAWIKKVQTGLWRASLVNQTTNGWGIRCASLSAHYYAFEPHSISEERGPNIDVDSGQAGIFDAAHYQDNAVIPSSANRISERPWYNLCCTVTSSANNGGILPYGTVAASGFGDGSYRTWLVKDPATQFIVAVRLEFI